MLLNVSHLLAANSSHETLSSLLTTQHIVLLPVNFLSILLNGSSLLIVSRAKSLIGMLSATLVSLALINTLNSMIGAIINTLYLTGVIGCSGSCEMTFDPDPEAPPGILVTLLRYSSDVFRTCVFWHILMSAIHYWLLMTAPLRTEIISRRKTIFLTKILTWVVSLLGSLPVLVDGLLLNSDALFFTLRAYATPVVHTLHTVVVFGFYYKLAGIAIHHIAEVAKLEKMQTRFHPRQASLKRQRSQSRKNAYVIQLIVFFMGPFLATMGPGIYYRAFRPDMKSDFSTVRTLLALDGLPAMHYLLNILVLATANRPFKKVLREHLQSIGNFPRARFCWPCVYFKNQMSHSFNNNLSMRSVSFSNGVTHSFSVRSRTDGCNRVLSFKNRGEKGTEEIHSMRAAVHI